VKLVDGMTAILHMNGPRKRKEEMQEHLAEKKKSGRLLSESARYTVYQASSLETGPELKDLHAVHGGQNSPFQFSRSILTPWWMQLDPKK
jgi:hypothetical protein